MVPMRCRSPTNFLRWLHRSVQFEAPQFLSWKIPSSDQQRDTTPDSASAEPKGGQSSSDDAHGKWEHIPEWLRDGGAELMTPGGILAPDCTRLSCLAQQAPSCGQRGLCRVVDPRTEFSRKGTGVPQTGRTCAASA